MSTGHLPFPSRYAKAAPPSDKHFLFFFAPDRPIFFSSLGHRRKKAPLGDGCGNVLFSFLFVGQESGVQGVSFLIELRSSGSSFLRSGVQEVQEFLFRSSGVQFQGVQASGQLLKSPPQSRRQVPSVFSFPPSLLGTFFSPVGRRSSLLF